MQIETLKRINSNCSSAHPVALLTDIKNSEQFLYKAEEPNDAFPEQYRSLAIQALQEDRCLLQENESEQVFVQPLNPPLRMIIVGAVHIAEDLLVLASRCGFAPVLVDPRQAFANEKRFPGTEISNDWPDVALTELAPDSRTAIITLSHDPKIDDPALEVALKSDAFYIGSLGSRRTHASRLQRLEEKQFDKMQQDRINGPIGLDIGAKATAEIAVAIMAEVIAAYRKRT